MSIGFPQPNPKHNWKIKQLSQAMYLKAKQLNNIKTDIKKDRHAHCCAFWYSGLLLESINLYHNQLYHNQKHAKDQNSSVISWRSEKREQIKNQTSPEPFPENYKKMSISVVYCFYSLTQFKLQHNILLWHHLGREYWIMFRIHTLYLCFWNSCKSSGTDKWICIEKVLIFVWCVKHLFQKISLWSLL